MGGILKRAQHHAATVFSFADVEREADHLVEAAQARAAELEAETQRRAQEAERQRAAHFNDTEQQARERAQQIEAEAREQGREQGRREGLEQIRAETHAQALSEARGRMEHVAGALQTALETFERAKWSLLGAAEQGVLEVALAIARRVCHTAAGADSHVALAQAKSLIAMLQYEHDLELHVADADFELLEEALPDFVRQTGRSLHVELISDPALQAGDCVLRSRTGSIDARLDTQLDRVAAALLSADAPRASDDAPAPAARGEGAHTGNREDTDAGEAGQRREVAWEGDESDDHADDEDACS